MEELPPLREVVESGETALGARVGTFSPEIIELYGELGLDYAWLDFEHGGPSAYDSHQLGTYVRAGAAAGLDLMTRLPNADPALVRRVLDAGVKTILIPRVETTADLEPAINASRFEIGGEVGDRGIGGERSSRWGNFPADYLEREDDSVLVGAMIENESAVRNLDEILSLPELGFVFVGPADLSVSLGHPLEKDHPRVQEAIEAIRKASLASDIPIGRIVADGSDGTSAIENGYDILRIGGEISSTRQVLSDRLEQFSSERPD